MIHHVPYELHGLFDLSLFLAERGYVVEEICWSGSRSSRAVKVNKNLTRYYMGGFNFSLGNIIKDYPYLPCLSKTIEIVKPDVVHTQSQLFLPSLQAVRISNRLGLPCVVTVHGVIAKRSPAINFAQRLYLHTLALDLFRRVDKVICLTQSDAREIVKLGCHYSKIHIVPNAVDTERFRPCAKRETGLIVWVGRFVPEKGLTYLLGAARILAKSPHDFKFLLIGFGPLKTKIENLSNAYGLSEFFEFAGSLRRTEIALILGKATMFVFPSLKEGMPISVLEAMACGLPIVGSDISGIKEVVTHGQNGFLVPPRDPKALANAILTLLEDDRLRRRLGSNARDLMTRKYSWDIIIDRLAEVYSKAIEHTAK